MKRSNCVNCSVQPADLVLRCGRGAGRRTEGGREGGAACVPASQPARQTEVRDTERLANEEPQPLKG